MDMQNMELIPMMPTGTVNQYYILIEKHLQTSGLVAYMSNYIKKIGFQMNYIGILPFSSPLMG